MSKGKEDRLRRDAQVAWEHNILKERALDQARRDARVELLRARSREHSARAQVWEDVHRGLIAFFADGAVEALCKAASESLGEEKPGVS